MAINQAIFSGNLTADPRKFGNEDNPTLAFTVAVNCPRKVSDTEWDSNPFFMDCICFGGTAKSAREQLSKGQPVTVSGRIQPDNYVDKDGNVIHSLQMVVQGFAVGTKKEAKTKSKGW